MMSSMITDLAESIMALAQHLAPQTHATWFEGMSAEFAYMESGRDKFAFAVGALAFAVQAQLESKPSVSFARSLFVFAAIIWGLLQAYFLTIIIDPNLPINFFAHTERSFTAFDLQRPWQVGFIYTGAFLFVLSGFTAAMKRDVLTFNICLCAVIVLALKSFLALGLPECGIQLTVTLNLLPYELAALTGLLALAWFMIPNAQRV